MSSDVRASPTLRAPLLAALAGGLIPAAVALAVILIFDSGVCDDSGFGCLGPAVLVAFLAPPITTVLLIVVISKLGVPRARLVGLAALASLVVVSYAQLTESVLDPFSPPVAVGLLGAVLVGGWAFVLQPGRPTLLAPGLAVLLVAMSAVSLWFDGRQRDQDAVERLAGTGAPAVLLDDPEWLFVTVSPGDRRLQLIYDAVSSEDTPPRITITTAERPTGLDPDSGCAAATALVFDPPAAEQCDRLEDDLWRVTQGSATMYLALRGDAVIGLSMLFPDEFTPEQLDVVLAGLHEVSYQTLAG